jgi:cytidylate kinase
VSAPDPPSRSKVIAIDGPAAAGKGTLARRLANHFGLAVLDTGALYRAVALRLLRAGAHNDDVSDASAAARAIQVSDLVDPELRSEASANLASRISALPEVRAVLLDFQRDFARNPPAGAKGAVLDGRDVGTRVCPDADVKFFVTASVEVRARRRVKELRETGHAAIHSRVLKDMKERDARDRGRELGPLVPADDAIVIDTGALSADQVFATALDVITSRDYTRRG